MNTINYKNYYLINKNMGLCFSKSQGSQGPQGSRVDILRCPKGYNSQQFQIICQLFDRLDKDSNMGVCREELGDVAQLHVKNRLRFIREHQTHQTKQKVYQMQQTEDEGQQQILDLKTRIVGRKNTLEQQFQRAFAQSTKKITWLESLDEAGKTEEFLKVLKTKDGQHIDFWSFFEYMKNKTQDIQNIT